MLLEINDLSAGYSELRVLNNISLNVNNKEVVCIIGPNGAGKTTLLKTIVGLLKPYKGSIKFLGRHIENMPPYKIVELGIAMVPQGRELFPYMSVLENLMLGAYVKRAEKYLKDSLEFVFQLFPILKERRMQMANTLSGGEQQMLAIARALMCRPTLLILDEPTTGLAPHIQQKVYESLGYLREQGITLLIVEQNIYQVLLFSDRGYVLESGNIVLSGDSKTLLKDEHVKKAYLGM
jgi:branched-chain amino acid transport system ATP-binding protein